jgi:hypothetical protein
MSLSFAGAGAAAFPTDGSLTLTLANKWYLITWDHRTKFISLKSTADVSYSFDDTLTEGSVADPTVHFPLDPDIANEFRVGRNLSKGARAREQMAVCSATAGAVVFAVVETQPEGA